MIKKVEELLENQDEVSSDVSKSDAANETDALREQVAILTKRNDVLTKQVEEGEIKRKEAEKKAEADAAKSEMNMKQIMDAEKRVKLTLFKDNDKYKDPVFVAINGMSYMIERGVEVEVPECVAEAIKLSLTQDTKASEKLALLSSKTSDAALI